jgi:signal transduction histidine kinase/DNA-binding NarL/FixJ family response regulator
MHQIEPSTYINIITPKNNNNNISMPMYNLNSDIENTMIAQGLIAPRKPRKSTITNKYLRIIVIIMFAVIMNSCSFNLNKLESFQISQEYVVIELNSFETSHVDSYDFKPYQNQKIPFNELANNAIFRIRLKDVNTLTADPVLVVDYKYLENVSHIMQFADGSFSETEKLERLRTTGNKIFSSEKFVFNLKNEKVVNHYLIIGSYSDTAVMIKVIDKDTYIRFDRNIVTFFTVLYSSLFGLFLINFVYYIFIRKTAYLYYSAYIFFSLNAVYWMEGQLVDIPLISNLVVGNTVNLSIFFISNLFLYIFIYKFLQLNWRKQFCGKMALVLIVHVLLLLIALIVLHFTMCELIPVVSKLYNYTVQVGNMVILMIAYIIYINGNRQAGFLLVSFLIFIVFSSFKLLFVLNLGPNQFWMQHSYEIGLVIEAFILAIGLADQALEFKNSFVSAENKFAKANKALFAESLISNFRFEVKEEILKENLVQNFIVHIESKFADMIMKFAPVDNLKRLSVKDGSCLSYTLFQQNDNGCFQAFFDENKAPVQTSCEDSVVFSKIYYPEFNQEGIQFIVIPATLNYSNDNVDHECLIFEMKKNHILDGEEIEDLYSFISKSLKALIDSKEIKQITKHAQNIISVAQEKEKSMRMKDRFFANVSHEFRTPLTLTIAPLKDLHKQSEFLNTSGKYLVDTALSNALDLMSLVDKILDVQKLETNTFPLRVAKVNLNRLTYAIINQLMNWALDHSQTLTFIKTNKEDTHIYCDIQEIKKVITNLISNAIKYSGKNSNITLEIHNNSNWVTIHISDDGVGIQKDIQEYIFERYYQGNSTHHLSEAGTGIGLSYVKDVMELHHGKITLESQLGKGSQFVLWFKTGFLHFDYDEISGSKEKSVLQEQAGSDYEKVKKSDEIAEEKDITTLLIVEDNSELRKFLAYKFNKFYKVIEADNGKNGLNKARIFLPDLIISDVMMPEMDGIEMVRRLRNVKDLTTVPIILLTAKSANVDTIEGLQTGADDYITKPFDFEELLARVDRLIASKKAIKDETQHLMSPPIENIKSVFQEKLDEAIVANIADKKLNVEKLAKILFIDRSTLYRKIKNKLEMSPIAYIRKVRMEFALNLLKNKKLTVSETAYACGFDSLSYFSKQFKKTHGTSPSDVL